MPEEHARLSASSSHRWLNCPGSASLEELYPSSTSVFAEEGTKAHAYAEQLLIYLFEDKIEELKAYKSRLKDKDIEMYRCVMEYVEECMTLYESLKLKNELTEARVELKVDLSKWIPKGFGTSDFNVVSDGVLYIRDLKYGRGVKVEAKGNTQLQLYALGVYEHLDWLYDIKRVNYGIIQPRLDWFDEEEISIEQLIRIGEEIKTKAILANSNVKEYHQGTWCKFCKARSECKIRMTAIFSKINNILKQERK